MKTPLQSSLDFIASEIIANETDSARDQDLQRVHKILAWLQANEETIKAVAGIFNTFPGAIAVSGVSDDDEIEERDADSN